MTPVLFAAQRLTAFVPSRATPDATPAIRT